ncbi:hypothetical protein LAZ67_2001354 [Cordylochernes scorpioides]|uniref:Carboxylesterase type B domain-containing protein n=1 Tax=Cordylochernes scorpioides TaxID=51811 RepID=A0ABY6K1E6_9ARAC|nr:hypothetical protein LAZ67_2001354 [Cordylochernes scorpioides]
MIWVYGGAFLTGSISFPFYNELALAGLGDVVFVTINYRVGSFGLLTAGTADEPGNLALYDQQLAFTWVKDNIHHFGRDPSKITILARVPVACPLLPTFFDDMMDPDFILTKEKAYEIPKRLMKDISDHQLVYKIIHSYLKDVDESITIALDIAMTQVFWIVFDFYLLKKMDQRTCIKFCVKNEIKCADAFRMLTVAYGESTLDRSNVYRWYKMFSEGREDVNDEERAGRPSTSTTDEKINEVEKMILANRRITVREVAEDLNISIGSCHSIFINDLGMRRVAAKFVPKLLNCDQKQHRMNIANEMLDSVRDDPNLL